MTELQPVKQVVITLEALTPAQQRVAAALLQGATITEAARTANVHRSTVYNWCRDNPAFRAALNASQRVHAQYIADELRSLVQDSLESLKYLIKGPGIHAATRLRASMAVLDRASRVDHHQTEPAQHLRAKIDAIVASIPATEFDRARDTLRHNSTLFKTARR